MSGQRLCSEQNALSFQTSPPWGCSPSNPLMQAAHHLPLCGRHTGDHDDAHAQLVWVELFERLLQDEIAQRVKADRWCNVGTRVNDTLEEISRDDRCLNR